VNNVRTSLVSVDVLAVRQRAGEVDFATYRRDAEPYAGRPALPGVLLLEGERLEAAGRRALATKTGLTTSTIGQLVVFDEPSRDPRGATLSAALWAVADDDSPAVEWRPLHDPGTLAFDHAQIVGFCQPLLAGLLWNDVPFTRALMGEQFTVGDAISTTTVLTGEQPDRGNLNKKLAAVPHLQHAGFGPGRGRPSLWEWDEV
jgi:ADP-ribose pyrophosphatase YjhB (NUDIX family)